MPMPQGTYLQIAKISKVKLRAQRSKAMYTQALKKRDRRRLGRTIDWEEARNIAYLASEVGSEPSSRADQARRKFAKIVEELDDLADELEGWDELSAEIREPSFEYRAVSSATGGVNAATVVHLAMAAIVFLMVLEKHLPFRRHRQ